MTGEEAETREVALEQFLARWLGATGSEQANSQLFLTELCRALGLEVPHPATSNAEENAYVFERHIHQTDPDGSKHPRRIDLYKRGCFVLESKKVKTGDHTKGHKTALWDAFYQAQGYVQALPADEGRPPFIVVVDIGRTIDLYAEFTRTGGNYVAYPDPNSYRIKLADLRKPEIQELLRALWLDPDSLDRSRHAAKVTREISTKLAELARSLERDGHDVQRISLFLMRSLFTMFAEDTGLIPQGKYTELLERLQEQPDLFPDSMRALWDVMNRGGYEGQLMAKIPRFNGGLFRSIDPIPLTADQIGMLLASARHDWTEVEPAIFGTLLERALDPRERHKLGAHYTPRAYVERLVLPTVIEPLREEWTNIRVTALADYEAGRAETARQTLRQFHYRLCETRILDPACGSGNFLYVAMEHLKRLEGEVLGVLADLSSGQTGFDTEGLTLDPHQFLGVEVNPRAAAITEMVLWIGYLQWHYRLYGRLDNLPEPILRDFHNIEYRDALIEYDGVEPRIDDNGNPMTIWDGRSYKQHPTTGELVPDEAQRATVYTYHNPRRAEWPEADFVVGNPPFIGAGTMRRSLGDGYVEALRTTYKGDVPDSADFVMYWWWIAAKKAQSRDIRRFGFITTNSIRQTFNRRVIQAAMADPKRPLSVVFAVPDHPWVDSVDGANVRIAMTVAEEGEATGKLLSVNAEYNVGGESLAIDYGERQVKINSDLSAGADTVAALRLRGNADISNRGVSLHGSGFIVTEEEVRHFRELDPEGVEKLIHGYRNGRDLTQTSRGVRVIDLYGHDVEYVRVHHPAIYQRILERVKPERDQNKRESRKRNWYLFGEPNPLLRTQLSGLDRYIATVETAKHRVFTFLDHSVLPDNKLLNIALDNPFHLGVLSSRIHILWALSNGSSLGVGNDPVYVKTRCFETFPFPLADDLQEQRISSLAERLDAHRAERQRENPTLTLTGMYNVLEKLRSGEPLSHRDRVIHEQGLVSVLAEIHDDLDRAVLTAYGWEDLAEALIGRPGGTTPLPDKPADQEQAEQELLQRLVALNGQRAAEEDQGYVRWLRPQFQAPEAKQGEIATGDETPAVAAQAPTAPGKLVFPKSMAERVQTVRNELAQGPQTIESLAERYKRKPRKSVEETLHAVAVAGMAYEEDGVWRLR